MKCDIERYKEIEGIEITEEEIKSTYPEYTVYVHYFNNGDISKESEQMNYVKAKTKFADGTLSDKAAYYKVERDDRHGLIYRNFHGGWCLKECIEIIESGLFNGTKEQFIAMHRREFYDYLIEKDSPYGWLSPYCEWFPCWYTHHQDVAVDYFGYEEAELESRGWIKVYKEHNSAKAVYSQYNATENQLEWLDNHQVHYSKFA